jgi:TolB-like protein
MALRQKSVSLNPGRNSSTCGARSAPCSAGKTLGLPIHRLQVGKQSSVYAFSELDKWYREREPKEIKDDPPIEPAPGESHGPNGSSTHAVPPGESHVPPQDEIPFYKWKSTWFGVTVLLVVGFLLARFGFLLPIVSWQPRVPVSPDAKLRLFVRPFQNISGDPGQAEFTEGLTNEINTRLGKLDPKHLGVIAPTSSQQLGHKPISELQPLLNLNYVLEGSVRRAGDQVRIDVSLISAKEPTQLWSDSYTEKLADILKVQDEVAEALARSCQPYPCGSRFRCPVDPEVTALIFAAAVSGPFAIWPTAFRLSRTQCRKCRNTFRLFPALPHPTP